MSLLFVCVFVFSSLPTRSFYSRGDKDDVYLNLVMEFIPEVRRSARCSLCWSRPKGDLRLEWGTTRSLSCCSHCRHPTHRPNLCTALFVLARSPRPALSCPPCPCSPACRPSTARFATTPRRTSLFRSCRPSSTCTSWRAVWHTFTRKEVSLAASTHAGPARRRAARRRRSAGPRARSYACARHVLQQWQGGGKASRCQFGWTLNWCGVGVSFWLSFFSVFFFFFFPSRQCATAISSLRMCFSTPRRPTPSCATLEGERRQKSGNRKETEGEAQQRRVSLPQFVRCDAI